MENTATITAHERNCVLLLGATAVIQSGHMLEHVAQLIQWMLRMPLPHGLIGSLDLEMVHFIYDGLFLLGLSALGSFYGDVLRAKGAKPYGIFLVAWIVQTYHMIEHVVRFSQHMETGIEGTPGILGRYVHIIPLHFTINLIVTVGIVAPFFMLGMHRTFMRIIARRRGRAAAKA
ncbi:MAG TPA: hypothetical protein VL500_07575 [Candidatus Eisenbacteria bacterium]|jgi:hypothetical protein|nr:hypothetical protein [Candidatus Eisenbacteria bacterium]